jgi:arylsulfatase A-like enzyme
LKLTVFLGVILTAILMVVAIERFSHRIKWKNIGRLLLSMYTFALLGMIVWISYQFILYYENKNESTALQLIIFSGITLTAILTWLFRNKSERWIGVIQNRITIWVWLFSIWVLLSVPLVAYYSWFDKSYDEGFETVVQSSKAYENRPNIILVTFDALTALDMSAYGYKRDTTPFISEWAKEASLFSRAKASAAHTAPTTASLMTGKRVWNHRVFQDHGYKVYKGETENISRLLKQNGYYNLAYMSSKYIIPEGSSIKRFFDIYRSHMVFKKNLNLLGRVNQRLAMLFDKNIRLYDWIIKEDFITGKFFRVVDKTLLGGFTEFYYNDYCRFYDIEKQFTKILEDIDNDPPEPFFAWTHLYPPHGSYCPPEPYKGIFESSLKLKGKNLSQEAIKYHDIQTERARYDEYIRYVDEKFKEFIEDLRLRNKIKNTVIIFSSDHGMLGKDYNIDNRYHLRELRTNIPLIIKEPDREEGKIIDDLVEQIDIPATILDLAHIPLPDWIEGRSLVPLMHGKRLIPKPAFSMSFANNPIWDQITKGAIAIWDGDYKLIYNLKDEKSLLYNLKADPDELNNLIDNEPKLSEYLLNIILANLMEANEKIAMEKN